MILKKVKLLTNNFCLFTFKQPRKKFWDRTIINLKQSKNDFLKAKEIMQKYSCIEDTLDRARHFCNVAIDSLGSFTENKYKISLIKLIESSLNRLS